MAQRVTRPAPNTPLRETGKEWRHRQQSHQQRAQQHQLMLTRPRTRTRAPRQKKV